MDGSNNKEWIKVMPSHL